MKREITIGITLLAMILAMSGQIMAALAVIVIPPVYELFKWLSPMFKRPIRDSHEDDSDLDNDWWV